MDSGPEPIDLAGMEPDDLRIIVRCLLLPKLRTHPLPWRVEIDWAAEVQDADGKIVMKFMQENLRQAHLVIACAKALHAGVAEGDQELVRQHRILAK